MDFFSIEDIVLVKKKDIQTDKYFSRFHLVFVLFIRHFSWGFEPKLIDNSNSLDKYYKTINVSS